MFRLGLVVMIGAMLVPAHPAVAEETLSRAATQVLRKSNDPNAFRQPERERTVALQLQIRQQDFLDRDRSSFDRNDRVMFVTPTDRLGDKRFDRPKVLFGVVVRF